MPRTSGGCCGGGGLQGGEIDNNVPGLLTCGSLSVAGAANVGGVLSGSSAIFSADVKANHLLAGSGSAASPSYAFSTEGGLGVYRPVAGTLGLAAEGALAMEIGLDTSILHQGTLQVLAPGSAAAPAIVVGAGTTSGISLSTSSALVTSIAGASRLEVSASSVAPKVPVLAPSGAASAPSYSFTADSSSGLSLISAGVVGMYASGSLSASFDENSVTVPGVLIAASATITDLSLDTVSCTSVVASGDVTAGGSVDCGSLAVTGFVGAGTTAITSVPGTPVQVSPAMCYGFTFTPSSNVTVTAVQIAPAAIPGSPGNRPARIYRVSDQKLLLDAFINSASPVVNSYITTPCDATLLSSGVAYAYAVSLVPHGDVGDFHLDQTGQTSDATITGIVSASGPVITYPSTVGVAGQTFGVSFVFQTATALASISSSGAASVTSLLSSGTVSSGTNSMTCGVLSSGAITSSGTVSCGTNAMTCGALSSGAITSSGTFSCGTNSATCGAITSSGTFSCGTNSATCGALSGTTFTLSAQPCLVLASTASQSVSNSTDTTVTTWNYGAPLYNTGSIGYASGVFTIPSTGLYAISYTAMFVSNATGSRAFSLRRGGGGTQDYAYMSFAGTAAAGPIVSASAQVPLAAADTLVVNLWQNSGGSLTAMGVTSGSMIVCVRRII